ncbi:MAG TPA: hypothetical protein VFW98_13155 [Gemmatimonadaceae bacterium]|nr:hypothetical protein [Gemmatimonadaceae bacterium]
MMHRARAPQRRWLYYGSMAVVVLVALAVAGEIVLRVAPGLSPEARARSRLHRLQPTRTAVSKRIKIQEVAAPATYAADPYLGAVLAPNEHDTVTTPEYRYARDIDHAGFPNRDPWPRRVDAVVLGSSLVMGPGVGIDKQFSTLLERRFPGHAFLNLGVPGGGSEMEYRAATRYAEPYRPALVIVAIWLASDIDNSRQFAHWLAEKPTKGFTEYRFQYGSTHPDIASNSRLRAFLQHSSLFRAIDLTTKALLVRAPMRERVLVPGGDTLFLSVRLQHALARGLARSDTPQMREVFFGPLQRLERRVESRGGHFLVVLLPSKEELFGAQAFPPVLTAIRETRRELRDRKIPFLDLYPVLDRPDAGAFFPTDIHYTARGNAIIANAIAGWITEHHVFGASSGSTTSAPVG